MTDISMTGSDRPIVGVTMGQLRSQIRAAATVEVPAVIHAR